LWCCNIVIKLIMQSSENSQIIEERVLSFMSLMYGKNIRGNPVVPQI